MTTGASTGSRSVRKARSSGRGTPSRVTRQSAMPSPAPSLTIENVSIVVPSGPASLPRTRTPKGPVDPVANRIRMRKPMKPSSTPARIVACIWVALGPLIPPGLCRAHSACPAGVTAPQRTQRSCGCVSPGAARTPPGAPVAIGGTGSDTAYSVAWVGSHCRRPVAARPRALCGPGRREDGVQLVGPHVMDDELVGAARGPRRGQPVETACGLVRLDSYHDRDLRASAPRLVESSKEVGHEPCELVGEAGPGVTVPSGKPG